jgi:hypothetical protein
VYIIQLGKFFKKLKGGRKMPEMFIYCSGCSLYLEMLEKGTRNLAAGFIKCPHTGLTVGASDVACPDGYAITFYPHRLIRTLDLKAIEALKKAVEENECLKHEQKVREEQKKRREQLLFFDPYSPKLFPQRGLYP